LPLLVIIIEREIYTFPYLLDFSPKY